MEDVLEALAAGRLSVAEARRALAGHGLTALDDIALLDAQRDARTGLPEVVLAEGKSPAHVRQIVAALLEHRTTVIVSRLAPEAGAESGLDTLDAQVTYDAEARLAVIRSADATRPAPRGRIAVITAGTADRAVAREAVLTAEAAGAEARLWVDRGVAAPARLAPTLQEVLEWAPAVAVVAAGREGTLPTVLSALLPFPVIGLPVSTGYGHGGRGEAALAAMLQSCSPLAVVNIDAGVTAGLLAARIARLPLEGPGAGVGGPTLRPELQRRQR